MAYKQLFRQTATLLRTALLLGAILLVGSTATAQPVSLTQEMPDAFETMTPEIGDGEYYFMQFYYERNDAPYLYQSFIGEIGEGGVMHAMDYMPYAENRLWTLVPGSDADHFKLKSKRGYYAYWGGNPTRLRTTASEQNAGEFTLYPRDGYRPGFQQLITSGGVQVGRWANGEWGAMIDVGNTYKAASFRFAKLKPNVAHIIYYREGGPDDTSHDIANPESTIRHYLTYSGANNEIRTSVIYNGDFESAMAGGGDMSCYLIGSPGNSTPQYATATQGAGNNNSKGVSITSSGNANNPQEWDTQFFIRATDIIPVGKTIHVEFDYRASENTNIQIQAQAEPGNYRSTLGSINFTTGWQRFSGDINVTNGMGNDIQTIAFNLWKGHAITYYFDNIVVTAPITTDVSSRRSIIPPDKSLWTLPTAAAYHQDGLWTLEETSTDGVFYIKRYGEEQYLTVRQISTDQYCTVLGNKDDVYGRFNLETPTNSRYTRIHNNCQYWGLQRYLSYSGGDGSPVIQGYDNNNPWWYAGFYPVEVPVPNKDEFFQVLVGANNNANMLNLNGGLSTYSEEPNERQLWQLEQIDDYNHFRLKDPGTGRYLQGAFQMTEPNNPTNAEINTNQKFWTDFSLKWFFVNPVPKEIPVDYYVTHRESYLKQYVQEYSSLNLGKQGLATEADSEWKNWNDNLGGFTQKVNHFEITHYVKQDNSMLVEFPTVLTRRNDHVYFQRFYNYDEIDTQMDLDNLKAHVSLDDNDDGNVQYFLYRNGMVTGQKLDWSEVEDGSYARYALRRFNFTNSDGQPFTVAVDVSRYSDYTYANSTSHLAGDLEEPSLTMRYIYYMRDAKEMAANLTAKPYIEGSTNKDEWLEFKEIHFPAKQIAYESKKKVGYRGEFLGVRHIFSDYWVFDDPSLVGTYNSGMESGADLSELNNRLVSAVNDINGGKIEVVIDDPNNTGIRLGGYNPNIDLFGFDDGDDSGYKGFYFYDKMGGKTSYGNSRFVVFRYPADGEADASGPENPAYVNVYLNNNGVRYQLAQFKIIFDPGTETLPWKDVTIPVAATGVQGTARDPRQLREMCGKPIAKISFDYPDGDTYHYPALGTTLQDGQERQAGGTIDNSSPIPLTFDKTNYSFDGDNTNWGSYAMVGGKSTVFGKFQRAEPANHGSYGYAIGSDPNFKSAFLYIDASEQPGDICSAPFVGDFCSGDKLLFTGWITGSNAAGENDNRCPGGVTLTVKGEHTVNGELKTETLYRFCPGQCYELDDNTEEIPNVSFGIDQSLWNKYHVVWQQFYFEFTVNEKYDRHWIEVNNNCVSSNGGDFMLDNIEVYAYVPEVTPDINTPVCVGQDGTVDMRLMKLMMNFNKLKTSSGVSSGTAEEGFVFLEKDKFLSTLKAGTGYAGTLEELAEEIRLGTYQLSGNDERYKAAFDAALLGNQAIWHSTSAAANQGAGVLYFEWDSNFNNMPLYTFAKAVERQGAVFRETIGTGDDAENFIVMNGNYPQLPWKANTEYYIIPSNTVITDFSHVYETFNLCSDCSKATVFMIEPPYTLLGLGASDEANDYMVCEGQIPTLVTDLKGYDFNGVEVPMNDINYDWWLGDKANGVLPTLDNYHAQEKGGVKLDVALSTLRVYYPDATSLDGIVGHAAVNSNPALTPAMVNYLKELVDAGQLILHQKSISVPATSAAADDPYFYLVACPIHDEQYDQALNPQENEYVAFFCDEPQGLRVKVGEKAPTLKTGFVPGENGFDTYDYSGAGDAVLSIRLAKREQFETVKHGESTETPVDNPATAAADQHFLWLPIRNAIVQSEGSDMVIQKSEDENIYLASTNDPVWDKEIYKGMKNGSLPVVGKIVELTAIDVTKNSGSENDYNRLCIYFTENFDVREGYSYTLSLPFRESPGSNTCDGTILINLKIVPDYEVWTGGAGNTDWNNDENWRRADGNLGTSTEESINGAGKNNNELYVTANLPATSGLKDYVTNYTNYRTAKDRLLRKGFAPLYCTHVLIKSNEWGDAPVLYDALAGKNALEASPFPNLRDKDGWDGTSEAVEPTKATSTPILRYDMQARHYELWKETYGVESNKGRDGDLIAEMYQVNSCDEIAFQPTAELLNAHLLNYNNAWVEYQIDNKRWYLLGSPLQGTISGEWYAPKGTAQQKTTYYEPVTFGAGYDRYSPAIYQRSWDKAKAVLYEVGANYSTDDNPDDLVDGGSANQGAWNNGTWNANSADTYLDRLGYKPMDGNKANVAIKGIWSNTYNDATVDYTKGGFSVMVMNHLKGSDGSGGTSIIRLPKEDTMYDYYGFDRDGEDNPASYEDIGTNTQLSDVQTALGRALNRGRLKTDMLLPTIGEGLQTYQKIQRTEATASRYGDMRTYTRVPTRVGDNALPMTLQPIHETVSAGASNLGYYLVENPFVAGLDMEKFFDANPGLERKYWILTPNGQHLVQQVPDGSWVSPTEEVVTGEEPNVETSYKFTAANAKVAPGQGFFVQATTAGEATTITFTADMQAQTRYGEPDAGEEFPIVVGTQQRMDKVGVTYDDDDDPDTPEVPLMIDDDNDPSTPDVQATVDVPVVDDNGNYVLDDIIETVTIYKYKQKKGDGYEFPLRTRGEDSSLFTLHSSLRGLVITAKRDNSESSALVMQRESASNDFLPEEDTEVFINSDLVNAPTVYTLCGRLATAINSIHDFRCLPVGVESTSDAPCTLTFRGVEMLGDSIAFYDAVEKVLTPLKSGMAFSVSGQTQNRYYLVRSLIQEEAAAETHLQIFTEGLKAKVIASTAEPITAVRCFDLSGQLLYSASPQSAEHSFTLPHAGVYIIDAQTENDRKTRKVIVK